MHTEIVANDYMHEISTGAMPETGHSAITHLAGTPSAICVTDNEGQVFEAQTGSDVTTVQLVHDAAQAIPQQVVETTTTELSAAAAILSVAGAHAFQQVSKCQYDRMISMQTDGQMDKHTDRRTDGQTHRQTDKQRLIFDSIIIFPTNRELLRVQINYKSFSILMSVPRLS